MQDTCYLPMMNDKDALTIFGHRDNFSNKG